MLDEELLGIGAFGCFSNGQHFFGFAYAGRHRCEKLEHIFNDHYNTVLLQEPIFISLFCSHIRECRASELSHRVRACHVLMTSVGHSFGSFGDKHTFDAPLKQSILVS